MGLHCACREDIGYRCPMHATNWQARATAAEAKVAVLRDVPNHIWAEARDTEWDAGFNHAVKLFRAALETNNG